MFLSSSRSQLLGVQKKVVCSLKVSVQRGESSDDGGVSIIGGIKCRDQAVVVVEVDRYRDVNRQVILPIAKLYVSFVFKMMKDIVDDDEMSRVDYS